MDFKNENSFLILVLRLFIEIFFGILYVRRWRFIMVRLEFVGLKINSSSFLFGYYECFFL